MWSTRCCGCNARVLVLFSLMNFWGGLCLLYFVLFCLFACYLFTKWLHINRLQYYIVSNRQGVVDDYFIEEHNVTIEKEGTSRWRSRISVNIEKAGIKVKFYQWKNLIIDISTKYKNNPKLSEPDYEGFCGNYNGNKVDDGENLDRLAQHALISG